MTTNRIPICPSCGRDWSKHLPPFGLLTCPVCTAHKQVGIDYAYEQMATRLKHLPKLTGEALRQAAEAGRRELYPDDYKGKAGAQK